MQFFKCEAENFNVTFTNIACRLGAGKRGGVTTGRVCCFLINGSKNFFFLLKGSLQYGSLGILDFIYGGFILCCMKTLSML